MQEGSYILSVNVVTKFILLTKAKFLILWASVLSALAILLIFPTDIRNGGTNGAFLCIQVLIPSLFPFMVLSDFIVRSGLSARTPKAMGFVTKLLFSLPYETFWVILLSFIGGYPTGARGIKALYEKGHISETEAKRMSLFLVGAGPGFLLTFMGSVMLRDTDAGYILLTSQTLTIIITGILSRINRDKSETPKRIVPNKISEQNCGSLVESVSSTVKSMAKLCGLVVLFSAFCEVFLTLSNGNEYLRPLCAFFEITTGAKILSEGYSLPFISFFTAFGGLCVHLQIHSLLSPIMISKLRFFIMRLISGVTSMFITNLLLKVSKRSDTVFSSVANPTNALSNSTFGCIMLIICSATFLASIKISEKIKNGR